MARPSVVPRALGRGSSLTELQLDANQSSITSLLAPSYNTITNSRLVVLHRQVELGSTTLQYKSQCSEDVVLFA